MRTSLVSDHPATLWQRFMPRRKEIVNTLDTGLYDVQVYDGLLDPGQFTPDTYFEKWAAVEVRDVEQVPEGMERLTLIGGRYAIFIHQGLYSHFKETMDDIFMRWLPGSAYALDDREHFEIMRERYYGPNDPNSEEEIWIPIKSVGKG